ncbi:MAG: sulfatase [Planctomycetes bacterium]|nr:sulfatase [Planctomycetota bacterium]
MACAWTRRQFLGQLGVGLATAAAPQLSPAGRSSRGRRPPNIVVIFTDDQGYGDVGAFGAKDLATPHLDRAAAEGVRFTSFYVAQPVCSASRAGLLTGCYPNRVGISGALGPNSKIGISDDEVTLAELCRARGYATAIFGKWHLGHHARFLPTRHGFDEFLGIPYSNDMWPLHPDLVSLPADAAERKRSYPDLPLLEGEQIVNPKVTPADQTRFTATFTRRAVDFIRRNRARPFFLYVPHPMPHVPLFASERFRGKSPRGLYGDVISEIDWCVGRILETLRELDLDQDTLVIFTSDNGPWLSYGNHSGTTGPLREGKGTTWEGGVRVPCIARWPGKIPAGATCDEPAMTIDILPTVAGLIGASLPMHKIDGKDIWPLMAGADGAKSPHEVLYFYYHQNDLEALRAGRWKLVFQHQYRTLEGTPGQDGVPGPYTHPHCGLELYDLKSDIGEQRNVAEEHPEVVKRLQGLAELARQDLGDSLTDREGRNVRPPGRIES